jgi:hypothetical protein
MCCRGADKARDKGRGAGCVTNIVRVDQGRRLPTKRRSLSAVQNYQLPSLVERYKTIVMGLLSV